MMANEEQGIEPAQMDAADINAPPAQDSPKNIVNILNDDCLQLVLLKLKSVGDFWSATQVCTRFQANAKACFPFKKVKFSDDKHFGVSISLDSVESFLSLFGPRLKSIHCVYTPRSNVNLISQHCGQTLTELRIGGFSSQHFLSPFQALKELKLEGVSIHPFDPSLIFPQLERLEASCSCGSMHWLANHFPMLQYVKFGFSVSKLADKTFFEFQKHNPQLQGLHCLAPIVCGKFRSWVWKNIEDRLPNITELRLMEIGTHITHLTGLKQLRKLQLQNNLNIHPDESYLFFRCLAERKQPIEELDVCFVNNVLASVLKKLKTIKVLSIKHMHENDLLELVENLPDLEELYYKDGIYGISLLTMRKILENCEKITKLHIIADLAENSNESINEYETIVALATGRVKLYFAPDNLKSFYSRLSHYNNDWIQFVEPEDEDSD